MDDDEAVHPIGVVAKRTGITLHVLRAWERRYGVVEPVRTEGGQRLYSDADIRRLRMLRQVTDAGRSISQVAELTDDELARLATEDVRLEPASVTWAVDADVYVSTCLEAGERLDIDAVHATLMRAAMQLGTADFASAVVQPLLHTVGERWHVGRLGPAQEHAVSVAVRRVLMWLLSAYDAPAGAPVAVVTTVAGEQHEFGAMLVSTLALEAGWRVSYLGPSLPADEIVRAAQLLNASLVAVSIVGPEAADGALDEVGSIVASLPATVTVLVGGTGAAAMRAVLEPTGAQVVETLDGARDALRLQRELEGDSR